MNVLSPAAAALRGFAQLLQILRDQQILVADGVARRHLPRLAAHRPLRTLHSRHGLFWFLKVGVVCSGTAVSALDPLLTRVKNAIPPSFCLICMAGISWCFAVSCQCFSMSNFPQESTALNAGEARLEAQRFSGRGERETNANLGWPCPFAEANLGGGGVGPTHLPGNRQETPFPCKSQGVRHQLVLPPLPRFWDIKQLFISAVEHKLTPKPRKPRNGVQIKEPRSPGNWIR